MRGLFLCLGMGGLVLSLSTITAHAGEDGVRFFDCGVNFFDDSCTKEKPEKPKPEPEAKKDDTGAKPETQPTKAEKFEAGLKHLAEEPTEQNADSLAAMYLEGLGRAKLADELLSDALRRRMSGDESAWRVVRTGEEGRSEPFGEKTGWPAEVSYDLKTERPVVLVFCSDTSVLCVDQVAMIKDSFDRHRKSMDLFLVTPPDGFTGSIQAGIPRRVNSSLYDGFQVGSLPTFAVLDPARKEVEMWRGMTTPRRFTRRINHATRR